MLQDICKYDYYVLSDLKGDFDQAMSACYKLGVWVDAPKAIRMQRIKQKSMKNLVIERNTPCCPGGNHET
ncbi:MAG: hypothetical protein PWP51_2760 [Clostridiales bacterium]|nr:hypothetical protein [Clostridiales bacterium]